MQFWEPKCPSIISLFILLFNMHATKLFKIGLVVHTLLAGKVMLNKLLVCPHQEVPVLAPPHTGFSSASNISPTSSMDAAIPIKSTKDAAVAASVATSSISSSERRARNFSPNWKYFAELDLPHHFGLGQKFQ
jgi:hypothetical protein